MGQISSPTSHDAFKAHHSVTSVSGLGGICPFSKVISFLHSSYMLKYSLLNDSNSESFPTFLLLKWNKGQEFRLSTWSSRPSNSGPTFIELSFCKSSTDTFPSVKLVHSMSPSPDPTKTSYVYPLFCSRLSKCYPFFTFQLKSHILHETFPSHPSPKSCGFGNFCLYSLLES